MCVTVYRLLRVYHPDTRIHGRAFAPNQPDHLCATDRCGRPLSNQSDGAQRRIQNAAVSSANELRRDKAMSMWFAVRWTYLRCCSVDIRSMATAVVSKTFLWQIC